MAKGKVNLWFRRLHARSLYRFAVACEVGRISFISKQYDLMMWIVSKRNKLRKGKLDEGTTREVESIYTHRYANWGKYVFLEDPNKDWFLKWKLFIKFL